MSTAPQRCLNCEAELQGLFCATCGQRDQDLRAASWTLLADFIAETFEVDGRLANTLPLFLWRPGELVRSFVDGRRQRYTSPVKLLLFALAIGFLGFGFAGGRAIDAAASTLESREFTFEGGIADISTTGGVHFKIADADGWSGLRQWEGTNQRAIAELLLDRWLDRAPTLTLLLVPWLALALELVYPRFLVIEHLLLSMVLHAQGLLIFGALLVVGHPLGVLFGAGWMSMMLYRGLRGVYGQTHARTSWKWALAVVTYVAGWLAAMLGSILYAGLS